MHLRGRGSHPCHPIVVDPEAFIARLYMEIARNSQVRIVFRALTSSGARSGAASAAAKIASFNGNGEGGAPTYAMHPSCSLAPT